MGLIDFITLLWKKANYDKDNFIIDRQIIMFCKTNFVQTYHHIVPSYSE